MTTSSRPRAFPLLVLVGVKPGEARVVVPSVLLSFLAVGATLLTGIAADSLFVSTFSLGDLSRFYVVSSVLRVLVAFGYAAISSRHAGAKLDAIVLVATAALSVTSGVLARAPTPMIVYAICVAQLFLPPLLPLIAFNAVMSCLHARQAKRLLPLVAAAATVGSMAVGAVASALATRFGTGALLWLAAGLVLLALPLPAILTARAVAGDDPAKAALDRGSLAGPASKAQAPIDGLIATARGAIGDLREVPVVRVVVANALLAGAAVNFIDFAFKAALKARYGRDEMASFIGTFSLVSNGVVLVTQLFVTSRFVGRFGVRASLSLFPASLLGLGPLLAVFPGVISASSAKLGELVLRFALGASTADLLLTPASASVRTRAKVFVKGVAGPFGYLLSGVTLAAFGDCGPPALWLGALIALVGAACLVATSSSRRAYTAALSAALGEGRALQESSPATAAILRSELGRMLKARLDEGDAASVERVLAVMSDRLFTIEDVAPALASTSRAIRSAGLKAALRLGNPGDGDKLLAAALPDEDLELERDILSAAQWLGGTVARPRLDRALERVQGDDPVAIDLWATALVALAHYDRDGAVKKLRKASRLPDGPRRAAALRALGDLRERRAELDILRGMGSANASVFAEAARAAVLIDAQGAIASLVEMLSTGSNVRACARALALAGPWAIPRLVQALPTTRGEMSILPTAVAGDRYVGGTIRAARVLARLGPDACARVLERYEELGYRARNAVARSMAAISIERAGSAAGAGAGRTRGSGVDEQTVLRAIDLTVQYAEGLASSLVRAGPGLLRREIRHRMAETGARVLDLASLIGDRALIARARAALSREERDRSHALELLENVLPQALAGRIVDLLDVLHGDEAISVAGSRPISARPIKGEARVSRHDGWLEKCERFDRNELDSANPMVGVLEKVLVLRDSSLFAGLSGEELYPVAEIAHAVEVEEGEAVVREGDPGDALFLVASGTLVVQKGTQKLRELGPGAAFGELALLDGAPRAASIFATSPSRLLRIPREEFEALLDESPELARGVIRTLIGHLRSSV